jgi:hypothetical protein
MARSSANRIGLVGAMNANTFFVQRNPHYADWITWSRWEKAVSFPGFKLSGPKNAPL